VTKLMVAMATTPAIIPATVPKVSNGMMRPCCEFHPHAGEACRGNVPSGSDTGWNPKSTIPMALAKVCNPGVAKQQQAARIELVRGGDELGRARATEFRPACGSFYNS
jgi:hypothetical protein